MTKLTKDQFSSGFFKKEGYDELDPVTRVSMYLQNWDKSHGYKYLFFVGQTRAMFIQKFLLKKFNMIKLPKLDEQCQIILDNFDNFRLFLKEDYSENLTSK